MKATRLLRSVAAQGMVAGVAAVAGSLAAGFTPHRPSQAFLIVVPLGYWMLTGCLWAAAYHVGQAPTDAARRWGTMVAAGIVAGAAWLPVAATASLVGTDPYLTLIDGGWEQQPALLAREVVRLLRMPAGVYYLGITPTLFATLLAARYLAPGGGDGMVSRTLAMAMGGLVSGLLTKPWLMLTVPSSIHGPHVLGTCTIFVVFGAGLSLGEALAHKLDPPPQEPGNDVTRQDSGGADDSRGS